MSSRISTGVASAARLPSLDGLRAISIALVIVSHVAALHLVPGLDKSWRIDPGNLGVRTFFVISGFLITSLLLEERRTSGTISLPRFYLRRTFRIMPAFFVFLLAMGLAAALGWQTLSGRSLLHAATYTSNYYAADWPVGHSWSLSVEEQFYLLWPGVLLLALLRGGERGAFRAAAAMLLVSPLLRLFAAVSGHWPDNPRYAFETVADALAVGCLLARYRNTLWTWAPSRRLLVSYAAGWWPVAVLVLAAMNVRWPIFGAALGISLLNVAIAFGVERSVSLPEAGVGRLLNARLLGLVGTWSYSLYLWQQPFLAEHASLALPVRVAALLTCAVASYYLVERPTLRLRSQLERRWFARPRLTVRRVDTEVSLLATLTAADVATVRPTVAPPSSVAPSALLYTDQHPPETAKTDLT